MNQILRFLVTHLSWMRGPQLAEVLGQIEQRIAAALSNDSDERRGATRE